MRPVLWLLVTAAVAVAEIEEGPWVEEEDLGDYNEEREDEAHDRRRREAYVEEPHEEHVRVKRRCCDHADELQYRSRREADYKRVPRQVHQYEVYEFTDEGSMPSSPPYEEMLAASADHYHRVYAAPGAPAAARYVDPDVSAAPAPLSVNAASVNPKAFVSVNAPVPNPILYASNAAPGKFVPSNNHASPGKYYLQSNDHVKFPASIDDSGSSIKYVSPKHHGASPVQFVSSNVHVASPVNVVASNPASSRPVNVASPVKLVAPDSRVPVEPVPATGPVVAETVGLVQQLVGGQPGSAAGHRRHKAQGLAAGGGRHRHAGHHAAHGAKSIKGLDSHHHIDKGGKGNKLDEKHRKEYEEAAGKKRKHHDLAGHKGGHHEEAHGQKAAHFDEKKGHKKGHKTKGYHNKYHKDEFHKEHKFYDDFHKSGEHHRYGKFHAKHASDESGKKKAHHVNAGHDYVERGKKGYSNKGHVDADNKGYKGKHGHEEHHESHSDHGKKGASEGGKQWGYAKKN